MRIWISLSLYSHHSTLSHPNPSPGPHTSSPTDLLVYLSPVSPIFNGISIILFRFKSSYVLSLLRSLQELPVSSRVKFKVCPIGDQSLEDLIFCAVSLVFFKYITSPPFSGLLPWPPSTRMLFSRYPPIPLSDLHPVQMLLHYWGFFFLTCLPKIITPSHSSLRDSVHYTALFSLYYLSYNIFACFVCFTFYFSSLEHKFHLVIISFLPCFVLTLWALDIANTK